MNLITVSQLSGMIPEETVAAQETPLGEWMSGAGNILVQRSEFYTVKQLKAMFSGRGITFGNLTQISLLPRTWPVKLP